MKILFIITKSNWGGAQRYVFDLAHEFKKKDDVSVLLGGSGPLKERLNEVGIPTYSLTNLSRDIQVVADSTTNLFLIIGYIRKIRPEVVHLNSAKAGGLGAFASRLLRVKRIVYTIHGFAFNENRSFGSKLLIKIALWITILLSHKTICVSRAIYERIVLWPFVKNKLTVIRNGTKSPEYFEKNQARENLRHKAGMHKIDDHEIWVGTLAELHPIKGLTYAIESMNALSKSTPTLQYYILGEGEEREHLEGLIVKYNLQHEVHMIGHVAEAPRYLKAFDIYLQPSLSEALSLSSLEAGVAGLPSIASNVGGLPEVIQNGKTGILIAPKDPPAITNAIDILLRDDNKRMQFGISASEYVSKHFNLEDTLTETYATYTSHS